MRRCYFCDDAYAIGGWSGPEEPCVCGAMMSTADARELPEERYAAWTQFADDICKLGYEAAVIAAKERDA